MKALLLSEYNRAVNVTPLISTVAPLKEGRQWFERLYAREANLMKVILTPNGDCGKEDCA